MFTAASTFDKVSNVKINNTIENTIDLLIVLTYSQSDH